MRRRRRSSPALRERFPHLVVADPAMVAVWRQAVELARTDLDAVLFGETGVGKEVLAREIHRLSRRAREPFIAINVAAIPEPLLESELFGHERGAFTGATRRRVGLMERAHRGTLFLDELGHLPPSLQPKLLRVLEEKAFWRVGGRELIHVDVRVLAATERDLNELVRRGRFLAALCYRFAVRIGIPPLRERRADIPALVDHFLRMYGQKYHKRVTTVSAAARAMLGAYDWPGNVRQLQQVVEWAVVRAGPRARRVTVREIRSALGEGVVGVPERGVWGEWDELTVEEILRRVVVRRLERWGGHRGRAAESLGISRERLRRWCRRWGIDPEAMVAASRERDEM